MKRSGVPVRLRIEGRHLPGRRCGPYDDHVALQVGRDPVDPVPGDAAAAASETDLTDDQGMPRCSRPRPPAVEWSTS